MLNTIRQDYEYSIVNFLRSTRQVVDKYHPNIIWWVKNNEWLFQYNNATNEFLCHNTLVWSVLKKEYEINDLTLQYLMINVLDRKFDIGCAKPICTDNEINKELNNAWYYNGIKIICVSKLKKHHKKFMFDDFAVRIQGLNNHQIYNGSNLAIFEPTLSGGLKCYNHFWQYFKDEYVLSLDETKKFLEESHYRIFNKRVNITLYDTFGCWVHG